MKIKKAVITAAARGTRIYPVANSVQKSMLPIIDRDGIHKPILQIIAEEALNCGIEEICIVVAPGDDKGYLEQFNNLREALKSSQIHLNEKEQQVKNITNLLERVTFTIQEKPNGYGDAVYRAKDFVKGEAFLLLTGDYLYISKKREINCALQLIQSAELENCSVSAVNKTHESQISRYGTLTGKAVLNKKSLYRIEKIIEKPSVTQAELELQTPGLRWGYYLCFFGMSVFMPVVLDLLEEEVKRVKGEQVLLTPSLQKLAETEKYLALEIEGSRYDTSKKLGLLQAQIALGLESEMKDEILKMIIETMAETGGGRSR